MNLTEIFFKEFEKKGLTLVWQKRIRLTREQVEFLYRPYKEVYWFEEFVEVMTGGDSIISLWTGGDDIIELSFEVRERMRREYKDLVEFYDLHTADSEEIAIEQLRFLIGNEVDIIITKFSKAKGVREMLEKSKVLEVFIKAKEEKIRELKESLETTRQHAREAVPSMVSWSDTSKSQLSDLALEIEKVYIEAKLALEQLKTLRDKLANNNEIAVGSLFTLRDVNSGETTNFFMVPSGGGECVDIGNEEVTLISSKAPIAEAVMGKKKGEKIIFRNRTFEIVEIQ